MTLVRKLLARLEWVWAAAIGARHWRLGLAPFIAPRDRPRTLLLSTLVPVTRLVPIPLPKLALTVNGSRHTIPVRTVNEFAAAWEVFGSGEYRPRQRQEDVRRILDLGSNVGFATIYFAAHYPEAVVVAVEPAADTYQRLRSNVGKLQNVCTIHAAVGQPGWVSMDLSSTSVERQTTSTSSDRHGAVERVSLSELLDRLGWKSTDLLKIDIEGDEFAVFSDRAMDCVEEVVGELHLQCAPENFAGLSEMLPDFAVEPAEVSNDAQFVTFRARRSRPRDHR